jgi:hypothetical protein
MILPFQSFNYLEMLKILLQTISLICIITINVFCQSPKTKEVKVNNDDFKEVIINKEINIIHKDSITRPTNVAWHANLWEEKLDDFFQYSWLEYGGLVDSINDIHKIINFSHDGKTSSIGYYAVINNSKDILKVNLKNYKIASPSGRVIDFINDGKKYDLILFNFFENDGLTGGPICTAKDKHKYTLVTSINSDLSPEMDVYIRIDKHLMNDDFYEVTIENEDHDFFSGLYKISKINQFYKSHNPSYPFKLKYYEIDTHRIYLIEKGYFLELVQ